MTVAALSWNQPLFVAAEASERMGDAVSREDAHDARLVSAARGGDDAAFSELVSRHKQRVFATAARFARDPHQTADLAQEVFIRAYRNLSQFRGDAPFTHWMARVTISACYDFLRKERRVREQISLETAEWDLSDDAAERAIAAGRAQELVRWALARMAAEEQLILTLCELEERSVKEVAQLTGWSESNVKVRAFRARQNLKKLLESHHES